MFDSFLMVDWSGGNDRGARPKKDAIWACLARADAVQEPVYLRNRALAEAWIAEVIEAELTAGRRLCAGFDFPFGYPAGFAEAITGGPDPLALWHFIEARLEDGPKGNSRFDLAGEMNARLPGLGPFWGNGLKREVPHLPRKGNDRTFRWTPERRLAERHPDARGAFTCWQMSGAGAVGGQVLTGLPVLARLRRRFAPHVAVWPFEPLTAPVALVEIWPSLTVRDFPDGVIRDAWQVRQVAAGLAALPAPDLARRLDVPPTPEGWILGLDPM